MGRSTLRGAPAAAPTAPRPPDQAGGPTSHSCTRAANPCCSSLSLLFVVVMLFPSPEPSHSRSSTFHLAQEMLFITPPFLSLAWIPARPGVLNAAVRLCVAEQGSPLARSLSPTSPELSPGKIRSTKAAAVELLAIEDTPGRRARPRPQSVCFVSECFTHFDRCSTSAHQIPFHVPAQSTAHQRTLLVFLPPHDTEHEMFHWSWERRPQTDSAAERAGRWPDGLGADRLGGDDRRVLLRLGKRRCLDLRVRLGARARRLLSLLPVVAILLRTAVRVMAARPSARHSLTARTGALLPLSSVGFPPRKPVPLPLP